MSKSVKSTNVGETKRFLEDITSKNLDDSENNKFFKDKRLKMDPKRFAFRVLFVLVLGVMMTAVVLTRDRMPQSESYHDFADKRRLISWIPNTMDTLSNLPFLLVRIYIYFVYKKNKYFAFIFP